MRQVKTAQQVKTLIAQPGNLSPIPEPIMEEENQFPKVFLFSKISFQCCPPHVCPFSPIIYIFLRNVFLVHTHNPLCSYHLSSVARIALKLLNLQASNPKSFNPLNFNFSLNAPRQSSHLKSGMAQHCQQNRTHSQAQCPYPPPSGTFRT